MVTVPVVKSRVGKKLIEVALPLDAINKASAREKSIRHGHPSTLHLWWARRPLAAARAVIFAQMVDDPSEYVDVLLSDPKKKRAAVRALKKRRAEDAVTAVDSAASGGEQTVVSAGLSGPATDAVLSELADQHALRDMAAELERDRLFAIIEDLVLWKNTTNEEVLERARAEIWQSWRRACAANADHPRAREIFDRNRLPAFHDPFAGGGSLPLEAQRLGLEAHASDLNPVAVLINKAMIEIPPKFAGKPPVNPEANRNENLIAREWKGAQGLAEDVRYYGQWMRDEAEKRIGHLYPKIAVTPEMVRERPDLKAYEGRKLTVIAWLWARTVKSPNPAFADVGRAARLHLHALDEEGQGGIRRAGDRGAWVSVYGEGGDSARCGGSQGRDEAVAGGELPLPDDRNARRGGLHQVRGESRTHIRSADGDRCGGRSQPCVPTPYDRARGYRVKRKADVAARARILSASARVSGWATTECPSGVTCSVVVNSLPWTTFSDLVKEALECIRRDARALRLPDDGRALRDGGAAATAYAEAVGTYLAFALSKQADLGNSLCRWEPIAQCPRQLFGRQAIPMIWDFAEGNPLGRSSGSWTVFVDGIAKAFAKSFESVQASSSGRSQQADVRVQSISRDKVVSTDPPYYDNIGYADLSDFFYRLASTVATFGLPGHFRYRCRSESR